MRSRLLPAAWLALLAAGARAPAQEATAYYCTSKIGGGVPHIGKLHHASVAICPCGEAPVLLRDGTYVSNPACAYYGTHRSDHQFRLEPERVCVRCYQARAPVEVVQERVRRYDRRWRIWNTCQRAARWATGR
jgi:hypothetical protein